MNRATSVTSFGIGLATLALLGVLTREWWIACGLMACAFNGIIPLARHRAQRVALACFGSGQFLAAVGFANDNSALTGASIIVMLTGATFHTIRHRRHSGVGPAA